MCHSRSSKFADPWRPGQPLLQTHLPSLLEPGLFEADGKSLDEVYNYAPFRQSKMFMAAVSCSDCHDPHSLKLVADGNAVCEQCHDGQKYAAASHHHHADGSAGARCVACHMSVKTYMQVDARHDHAFRVPRPDESVRFGTSNACNDCHTDNDAAWAAAAAERWFGLERKGFQTWTETFAAACADKVDANALLLKLATSSDAPSIARATAFESLAEHPTREAVAAAQRGLADADPLVRLTALRTLRALPVEQSWPLARGVLTDPVRGVRIEAASLLSGRRGRGRAGRSASCRSSSSSPASGATRSPGCDGTRSTSTPGCAPSRAAETKSDRAHLVPLPALAIGIITSLPRFAGSAYVFPAQRARRTSADLSPAEARATQRVSGYSKAKAQVDRLVAADGREMPAWRWHDLRRTERTNLSRLRVPDTVKLKFNSCGGACGR